MVDKFRSTLIEALESDDLCSQGTCFAKRFKDDNKSGAAPTPFMASTTSESSTPGSKIKARAGSSSITISDHP